MIVEDDRSFWDQKQQEEEEKQRALDHLRNLLWLNINILNKPNAKELVLNCATKLGLKQEFEQYLKETDHAKH